MVGSFSDFLELELLDEVFGGQAYTPPATVYIAACTAPIVDSDDGSTITEPVGNGYARVTAANNKVTWTTAAAGALENAIAFTWPAASGGNWGTITDVAVCDAPTGGNILGYADLVTPQVINDGGQLTIPIGDLDISLD